MRINFRGQWRGWNTKYKHFVPVTVRVFYPIKFTGGEWTEQ